MQSKKLLDQLVRVERTVNVYTKKGDEPLLEINVDNIPFDKLKEIVIPPKEDSLLYDGYPLNSKQLNQINLFLENKIVEDFKKYNYILVCGGIYDWKK